MAGIITFLIIVALVSLLLFIKVSLTINYDERVALTLKVLFIKIRLYPRKEKKHRKKSMSARRAARIQDKLNRKKAKKKAKKAEKQAKKEKVEGKKKRFDPHEIINTIAIVSILVRELVSKFAKYIKIKIVKIHIKIATGDAAQTAVSYGALTQSINVLFPLLEEVKNFSLPQNRDIDIYPDFLSEDSEMELRLIFSLRVWQIFATALSMLYRLAKHYIKSLERKERKNHGN